ncbi:hypothetical protein EON65_28225 [archaeon]|nr:MAG: hypothetical protein EON65_28225 [archaeon]
MEFWQAHNHTIDTFLHATSIIDNFHPELNDKNKYVVKFIDEPKSTTESLDLVDACDDLLDNDFIDFTSDLPETGISKRPGTQFIDYGEQFAFCDGLL